MEKGLVSVVMPVWNSAATLATAVESLRWQTYDWWECLVVDDGSQDGSIDVVRAFGDERIHLIHDGRHRGLAERLNEGVSRATGEYVARMDADDISYPRRFEVQVNALTDNPDVDLTASWVVVFRSGGQAFGKRTSPSAHEDLFTLLGAVQVPHPTFLGRTEWFRRYPYVATTSGFEDQFLLLKTWSKSRFHVVPEILLGYREDKLTVRKQFGYRRAYFRARRELSSELGWASTAVLLTGQAGKMILDAVAIGTRAQHALLRKRARLLDADERRKWEQVWDSVSTA